MTRLELPADMACIGCGHDFSEAWATEWVLDSNGGDYYHPTCKVHYDFQDRWLAAQDERSGYTPQEPGS